MDAQRKKDLTEFVAYATALAGDEKGEAQVFLDRLFRGFGRGGYAEAGAKLEFRVKNNRRGTSFADLVWKPVVLFEMKKRGELLAKHLPQAFEYWTQLAPGRPRYVVLCNFDEFWVYDFELDINQPQDVVRLADLPNRYGPLNFLFPISQRPVFRVDREKATRAAADLLARVYNLLADRKGIGSPKAQRFVLQMLVSLFSEDIGLLPKHFVTQLLEDCVDPPKAFDLLHGLFTAMNAQSPALGGRFKDIAYFNGGLFSESAAVELSPDGELPLLKAAAEFNWADISPDIFGTIFQHSLGKEERHAFGAHYTAPEDIMKIVGPTITRPWRAAIESAKTPTELHRLRERLLTYRVLDPACGSGNFLYLAYRELKRIEKDIVDRLAELGGKTDARQRHFGFVSTSQFVGLDILPFAVELAKVTMTVARKLSIDELHIEESALPLDNLDDNIMCVDALIDPDGQRTVWPECDVIIGNPPFLGAKRFKPERGAKYVNEIRKLYPEVPGMADYCVYWIRRAHDHLRAPTAPDYVGGRAGLVGTQNIRNNQSRVGGLDHVVVDGTIVEAVENQPWSGEANVHVSIANWIRAKGSPSTGSPSIHLGPRRLWSAIVQAHTAHSGLRRLPTGARAPRKDKTYELIVREVPHITSTLSDATDVSGAKMLGVNGNDGQCLQGVTPGYSGFVLAAGLARELSKESPTLIKPYIIGRELVSGNGKAGRYLIDAEGLSLIELAQHRRVYAHLLANVMPAVVEAHQREVANKSDMIEAREEHVSRWWTFWARRAALREWMRGSGRIIAASRTQRVPFVFAFLSTEAIPGDKLQLWTFDDDYSFGIISSRAHCTWYAAKGARLKNEEDYNYSRRSVFETFPWPQNPTPVQVEAVASASRAIRAVRASVIQGMRGGLRALYHTLAVPGASPLRDAHAVLDNAVVNAYGFAARDDLLQRLLDLNLELATGLQRGGPAVGPGIPPYITSRARLVSTDCIQP